MIDLHETPSPDGGMNADTELSRLVTDRAERLNLSVTGSVTFAPDDPTDARHVPLKMPHMHTAGINAYRCKCGSVLIRYALSSLCLCRSCATAYDYSYCVSMEGGTAYQLTALRQEVDYGYACDELAMIYDPEYVNLIDPDQIGLLNNAVRGGWLPLSLVIQSHEDESD
jgi:hypothetical protein